MNSVEVLIPRQIAEQELRRIRYGRDWERRISQPTLWRWCDMAAIPSGLDEFSQSQFDRLCLVARGYRSGKSTQEILESLNEYHSTTVGVA